ncbi:hypothetical protein MW374_004684 [Vibrio parahaemolyticus]|uniref:Uncharacterized protein n=1 Tax=Vibrio parahaemolyticus TaxID=670 RepID=A0AA46UGE2_VIBPH|nr:hypothetical protein [Vibrio parahaemolyticus]AGR00020.1 hypothetical protein M636_12790 [Vibrio parahaemolyticus O1:K33 str. CDC_K4557]EGQ8195968.1 hypothetical protein [Vibrio parahaemolyticus]EGQ9152812.1 hypothetical protein [Vibrio parahaemolyticus]EGQ9889006.1 hypothetical protein [Vibrio parahaemolyticus]EGR3401176.1 hypothetical protein [Vibrio parahaemolyticus]
MMRKIEFMGYPKALSQSISAVTGGVLVLLVMQFIFSIEQSFIAYGAVLVGAIFQYIGALRKSESNLTTDTKEIYLFGIPAALRHQRSILGRRYIRITSLTPKGYHRVKVLESWVSKSDWQLMLGKCT